MSNTCYPPQIAPEKYEFYWKKIALSNQLVESIQLRTADKRKNNKIKECMLLSDFCIDLHKAIDECAYNEKQIYERTLQNLLYSYNLQFDKLNCKFLNEDEEILMNKIRSVV